jgi:hypothetical protein
VLFCDAGGAGICSTCDPGYSCPGGGDKVVCRAGQYAEAGLDEGLLSSRLHILVHTQNPYRRSKCILNNDSAPSYIRRRAGRAAGTAPPAGSPTAAAVRPVHPRLRGAPPLLRRSGAARRRARRGRRVLLELPVRLRLPGRLGQAAARRPPAHTRPQADRYSLPSLPRPSRARLMLRLRREQVPEELLLGATGRSGPPRGGISARSVFLWRSVLYGGIRILFLLISVMYRLTCIN